jgi:hypothetical protein
MTTYEELREEVLRRKRERWVKLLASEPPGRAPGRRPRDPEKERLLARLDRARLERVGLGGGWRERADADGKGSGGAPHAGGDPAPATAPDAGPAREGEDG